MYWLARILILLCVLVFAAPASAAIDIGRYKGVTGQDRGCGATGKRLCRASASVDATSVTFRWRFSLRCRGGETANGFYKTMTSEALTIGSEQVSEAGEVDYTHHWLDSTARRGKLTSVIRGAFDSTRFRGTLRVTMRYVEPYSGKSVTCRIPRHRVVDLVLRRI